MNNKPILENLHEKYPNITREEFLLILEKADENKCEKLIENFYQHLAKTICQTNRFGSSWMISINNRRTDLIKMINKRKNLYNYISSIIPEKTSEGIEEAIKEVSKSNDYDAKEALKLLKTFSFPDYVLNIDFIINKNKIIDYISENVNIIYRDKLVEYFKKYNNYEITALKNMAKDISKIIHNNYSIIPYDLTFNILCNRENCRFEILYHSKRIAPKGCHYYNIFNEKFTKKI